MPPRCIKTEYPNSPLGGPRSYVQFVVRPWSIEYFVRRNSDLSISHHGAERKRVPVGIDRLVECVALKFAVAICDIVRYLNVVPNFLSDCHLFFDAHWDGHLFFDALGDSLRIFFADSDRVALADCLELNNSDNECLLIGGGAQIGLFLVRRSRRWYRICGRSGWLSHLSHLRVSSAERRM